jgi:ABC-type transport system involved in cytochrome c biogenesis permease subunit
MPPRLFALIALAIALGVFFAARQPLSWLVEFGYLRGRRAQGLQAAPLYLVSYFLLQLTTGLTFRQLCDRWKSLSVIPKTLVVLALTGIVVALVNGYLDLGLGGIWVESGRKQ